MPEPRFVPWTGHREYSEAEMLERAHEFNADMQRRRTIRAFMLPRITSGPRIASMTPSTTG